MTPSDSSSGKVFKEFPSKLLWIISLIAFIGFLDATYLTVSHYAGLQLNCGINDSCSIVTSSKYSEIFGVPVALGGAIYYLIMLTGSLFANDSTNHKIARQLFFFSIAGLLASAWFVYLQFFILHAICWYCMGSAASSSLIFLLSMIGLSKASQSK